MGIIDAQGVDYFENLCLNNDDACAKERSYQPPRFGIPAQKVAAHVKTHFYVDKELMVRMQIFFIDFLYLLIGLGSR